MPGSQKAIFLDRDGTLVENVPYNVDPARVRLQPGAARALQRLAVTGYALVLVSNQSGIARGLFTLDDLARVDHHLRRMLLAHGLVLAGAYYCPHHPAGVVTGYAVACDCRKPRPGLLLRAADDLGLSLQRSWMIGDILDDVEAGARAGARTVLLDLGGETEWRPGPFRQPDRRADSWKAAADWILRQPRRPARALADAEVSHDERLQRDD
jgi:histidinol-phosphate phosphatase family protein